MRESLSISGLFPPLLWGVLILLGLYLTSLYSFLLFHSLAEIFSIVIAGSIFVLAWNSRHIIDNPYLVLIGIAYLFIGAIDLLHTLAYKGMGVFPGYGANLPTQLWIAARYLQSITFLMAPFWLHRRVHYPSVFWLYATAVFFLLLSIFAWEVFPDCFLEGTGLTPFKKVSEYIISSVLLASVGLLLRRGKEFDEKVLRFLILCLTLTIFSELAFTLYVDIYGFYNLLGHFFKVVAFYFFYKALIETGLVTPYHLLFRNLKQSEEALRRSHDELEMRIRERTAELTQANQALQLEIEEREQAEQALRESEKELRLLSFQLLAAQENERKWIAQELHDSIGQALAAIKFSLERKMGQINGGKAPPGVSLEDILSIVHNGIDETLRIMTNLRPSILDDLGILATLSWFCREFQKVYPHIQIRKEADIQEKEVPEHLKIVIFRILQEAMNNMAKHSQADLVQITLARKENQIIFKVQDNGVGFDLETSPRGLGLSSMKERAEYSGGIFTLESGKGKGTGVQLVWPA